MVFWVLWFQETGFGFGALRELLLLRFGRFGPEKDLLGWDEPIPVRLS